jgi:hypothetical protein
MAEMIFTSERCLSDVQYQCTIGIIVPVTNMREKDKKKTPSIMISYHFLKQINIFHVVSTYQILSDTGKSEHLGKII